MGSVLLLAVLCASPQHTRLSTSHGAVHVLLSPRATVTVVYVHGYGTHADEAWAEHRLQQQFEDSGVEAAFIVPEAPAGPRESVSWPELEALLREVEGATGQALPRNVIAAGHSGAYRTLALWTPSPRVRAFVLLDAFYTSSDVWEHWLDDGGEHRLFLLAHLTAHRSDGLCARRHGKGQVHCAHTRVSHMEIVTKGEALPALLKQATDGIATDDPV